MTAAKEKNVHSTEILSIEKQVTEAGGGGSRWVMD